MSENCRCESDIRLKNGETLSEEPRRYGDGDKALKNYGTWLQKRNEIHHKMKENLERGSGDLLMNLSDELREINEEREAIMYTKVPQKFDKYRGNPARWEHPPGLHDKCNCFPNELTYFYQKTKMQKNEIPEIDRVGLSTYIKCEKMLLPRVREVNAKWRNSEYRKKRFQELSSLLINIIPHKPIFEDLIIVGNQIQQSKEKPEIIHEIENLNVSGTETPESTETTPKYSLKINNLVFDENSKTKKFHIRFEYDLENTELRTKCIKFENIGRVTLRINWNKVNKIPLFRDIIRPIRTGNFCFDKNELILIPGEIVEFPIWFQSKKLCYVVENWEISTIPKFFLDETSVIFEFEAITHIDKFVNKITQIIYVMEQRVKKRIIKDLLEEALHKTKYKEFKTINYNYYEAELFEAANLDDDDPERNPKYLYNKNIVNQLKELYDNVKQIYHPKVWNLNVSDLQVVARIKDLVEYAEELTKEFSQCRKKSSKTSIHAQSSDKKLKKNTSDIKTKVKGSSSQNDVNNEKKDTNYGILMKLLSQLSPPCMKWNHERVKHFQIFTILRAYFTRMSIELWNIKPFVTKSKTFLKNPQYERLIFEKFDELQTIRIKKSLFYDDRSHPKPHILRNVASDNIETIHKLYFNKPSTVENSKRNNPKLDKNDKKKNKTPELKKRSASIIHKLHDDDLVIPNFDPFEDIEVVKETSSNETIPENLKSKKTTKVSYCSTSESLDCLNLYVTIYTNLTKAVETMVDTLESVKIYKIPSSDLEQLWCSFKFFVKDDILEKTSLPINNFEDFEDRQYFTTMLTAHLNEITTKYLICNQTETTTKRKKEKDIQLKESLETENIVEESPSIFTIPKIEIEEVSYKDKGDQTLPICPHEEILENVGEEEEICLCPLEFREIPSEVPEIFYYSDDENFDDLVTSSTESSKTPEDSSVPRKSTLSKNKIFSEMNQKKCSLDVPEENKLE